MVAPARDPRRAPRQRRPAAPHLSVVGRTQRRRRPGVRIGAGCLALFLALFGNAVAHSVLVSGQERLDGLTSEVEREQARNEKLHLQAAKLEAPDRIVNVAKGMGLIPAQQTIWLTPSDDPGSVASTTESRTDPTTGASSELAGTGPGASGHDSTDSAGQ
jgi:hypothetical protein